MRYFVICILLLVNACVPSGTIRISKNVTINPLASKGNSLRIIPAGEQIDFSYNILGTIYTDVFIGKAWGQAPTSLNKLLAKGAKQTHADAVVGVHISKIPPIVKERRTDGAVVGLKNYASGVLVKYTARNTDVNVINDNFVDILPLGNPDGVASETPFIKDRELVRYLVQQYVERNGYYARLIEGNLILNNINDVASAQVGNLGYANSKYLLYLWPSYIEHEEEDELIKAVVLNSVLINKKSREIVWKSEPTFDTSVGVNDAYFVPMVIRNYGWGKVSYYRASYLRRVVEDLYAEFIPNYKVLNSQPDDGERN